MRIVFETDERKVTTRTPKDDLDIHEMMDIIYSSLQGLTFSNKTILMGLEQLIEEIKCE